MELADLQAYSVVAFLDANDIRNEKGDRISFDDRLFLYDPMRDFRQYQVYKKASQIGMSVTMVLKTLFAAKYKGWNVIHTFPTDKDCSEFVSTKTNKILQQNHAFLGIQSDNIERKEIGDRFVFYKGTKSKTAAIMTTADLLVHDEEDRSDQQVIKDYRSRLTASDYKGIWRLSNPSVEGIGVDLAWRKSDQKEWMVTCDKGHSTVLTWPDSINMDSQQFVCKECGVEITDQQRRAGEWEEQRPGQEISGYHMSQLMAPWLSAKYIINEYNDGRDLEYFYNFVLGEPYSPGDSKIERRMILDCWTPKTLTTGRKYLGIDVGRTKHYVIGSDKGITEVGTFIEWSDLDRLLEQDFDSVVMDAMPENDVAKRYKDAYSNFYICYLQRDKQRDAMVQWGEKEERGIIKVDRNRFISTCVGDLLEAKWLYGLPSDQKFRDYIRQCESLHRIKEETPLGTERYVWDNGGRDDHYWFATMFYRLAVMTEGAGEVLVGSNRAVSAIEHHSTGDRVNLEEYLEERELWGGM